MSNKLNKYRDEASILQKTLDELLWPLTQAGFNDHNSAHKIQLSSNIVAGLALTCTWLRPYIAELCLKSLYEIETGQDAKYIHDLIKLHDRLTESTKNDLQVSYKTHIADLDSSSDCLRALLEAHRNHFINWRYLHEGKASASKLTLLDRAIAAMFDVIQSKVDGDN